MSSVIGGDFLKHRSSIRAKQYVGHNIPNIVRKIVLRVHILLVLYWEISIYEQQIDKRYKKSYLFMKLKLDVKNNL